MAELELTRSPADRRRYDIDGVGTLRLAGPFSRRATAEAGDAEWSLRSRGFWGSALEASDAIGDVIGTFEPRKLRRGGELRWGGRSLELRPASRWKERYALADGDHELALLDGKGWGKRPVRITVDEPGLVEPGLLLFATYAVRRLAEDAGTAATA